MVQKESRKRRGRPPAYDAETALRGALGAFWDAGFAATSLDELSAATGMNRPSLYGAFGDKEALYLTVLDRYRAFGREAMAAALANRPLREGVRRVYAAALTIYLAGDQGARGCFLIGTATTEAVGRPAVRAMLREGLRELDAGFEAHFRAARDRGELSAEADPVKLAMLASSVLHTLALRARAGEPRAVLEAIAEAGVELICGAR